MRLLFVCGTEGHNPHERTSKPTGGILNSLTLIPEYLVTQGHEVYVQSTYNKNEIVNGVNYITQETHIPKWDISVFNRNVLPKDFIIYNKEIGAKVIWWLHDLAQLQYLPDDAYKYVDHVVALSQYCKDTYVDFFDLNPDRVSIIPNGVDKTLFYPGKYEDRNKNLVITASSPVKGVMPLSTVLVNLKKVNEDIDFRVYSSQKLHHLPELASHQEFLERMEKYGAHIYAPVSPQVLSHLLRKAWCLLMPNSYPEICSNLLLQAQASGCPVVTSDIGSAPEFIVNEKTGAMTTKYKPHDQFSWIIEYTNLVLRVCGNKELHKIISTNSPTGVLNWTQIGEKWNGLLKTLIV